MLDISVTSSASHRWRSLLVGRDYLWKKLGWTIGDRKTVKIWDDHWISLTQMVTPIGPSTKLTSDWTVSELLSTESKDWDHAKVRQRFPELADQIISIKPSKLSAPDKRVWLGTDSGIYSSKSGYHSDINAS